MTALYRKYRPQVFGEVVGQEAVVRTLTNAIEAGKVRQAYLFAGPRGTGKTSLARILAKSVNCQHGPTAEPDNTCHSCVSIANGSSLDVIEMDAALASVEIDDIREIRERVVLQPVEGRSKVYILDEAHQLTDAAWNALLKLIEEPPPHLLFVFCTTGLPQKVLPTVRSRCQTFVFQRPRLPDLLRLLRRVADGEGMDVPDAALALVARSARGSFRDAISTLDRSLPRPAARSSSRTCSSSSARSRRRCSSGSATTSWTATRRARSPSSGSSPSRGRTSHGSSSICSSTCEILMLVQHTGEVPDTLPVTEDTRDRLREQANQLGAPTVVRLIDLLHVAVEDMRQGGDPRLPLELALVKVTRPGSDLSREGLAFRLDRLEQSGGPVPAARAEPPPAKATIDDSSLASQAAGGGEEEEEPPPPHTRAAAGGVAAEGRGGSRAALQPDAAILTEAPRRRLPATR